MSNVSVPSPPVRVIEGVELPAPGRWLIDPGHAEVGFVGRHLMFTKVRGRFRVVDGFVDIADDPNDSTVEATIGMASVDTGDDTRDQHLRSADLFDVARHSVAVFRGRTHGCSGRHGRLRGDLTLKGMTRPVELEVSYQGAVTDPWGGQRAVFSAVGTINREDWGISWNLPLASGGLLVSKDIRLELELETIREQPAP
jgi:polyisoprenoid-binding protein YceI